MDALVLHATKTNPEIHFEEGLPFVISGRSIPEDPEEVFAPILGWLDGYFSEKREQQTIMECRLEYLNSGSTKYIMEIFKRLRRYQDEGIPILVKWFYEEEDEAILELGEHFIEATGLKFELVPLYG